MEIWQSTVSIILAIVAAVLWITTRLNRLDRRLDRLGENIALLSKTIAGIINIQEVVLGILSKARLIDDEDQRALFKASAEADRDIIRGLKFTGNPLTPHEVERLEYYRNKLLCGEDFTPDEAYEFHKLVRRLKTERPDQEGTWVLVALAAFLLGMHAGSKET